jgi:hypothetical protein
MVRFMIVTSRREQQWRCFGVIPRGPFPSGNHSLLGGLQYNQRTKGIPARADCSILARVAVKRGDVELIVQMCAAMEAVMMARQRDYCGLPSMPEAVLKLAGISMPWVIL